MPPPPRPLSVCLCPAAGTIGPLEFISAGVLDPNEGVASGCTGYDATEGVFVCSGEANTIAFDNTFHRAADVTVSSEFRALNPLAGTELSFDMTTEHGGLARAGLDGYGQRFYMENHLLMPMYLANSTVNTTLVASEYQTLETSVTSVQLVVRLDGATFLSVGINSGISSFSWRPQRNAVALRSLTASIGTPRGAACGVLYCHVPGSVSRIPCALPPEQACA